MKKFYSGDNFQAIFVDLMNELCYNPEYTTPTTKEGLGVSIELTNIENNVVTNKARQFNLEYAKTFFAYVLSGESPDVYRKSLVDLNQKAADYLVEFEGRNTQYGPRIHAQLPEILAELRADVNTRRASILILDAEDRLLLNAKQAGKTTIEYPCTTALHFSIRDNKLNLVTQMRSQSACIVLCYDLFNWTNLMQYMTTELQKTYPNLKAGTLHHNMSSCHYYHREEPLVRAILLEETKL